MAFTDGDSGPQRSPYKTQADARAAEIESTYRNGGAQKAMQTLLTELEEDRKLMIGSPRTQGEKERGVNEFSDYFMALEKDLIKSGVLPALSLEFATNKDHKDDLFKNNHLTLDTVDKQLSKGFDLGAFDRMMLDGLKNFEFSGDRKDLTLDEVAGQKSSRTAAYKELYGTGADMRDLEGLTRRLVTPDQPGGKSLFAVLDTIDNPHGGPDGEISKDDLEQFRNDFGKHAREGGVWTNENLKLVTDLLNAYDDKNSPYRVLLEQMCDGSANSPGNILVERIANRLGITGADRKKVDKNHEDGLAEVLKDQW